MRSLLLVGHGSLRNSASARPVFRLADAVARSGRFADVRVAFWKEEPTIAEALGALAGHDVAVLPVFAADSYFTDTLIAREIGITPGGRRPELASEVARGAGRLRYTRPLGSHPAVRRAILAGATAAAEATGIDPASAALVLAGRGGQRRSAGRATTEQAAVLGASGPFSTAVAWFPWDEDQPHWTTLTGLDRAVIFPYALSDWWFSPEPLPQEFAQVEGRLVALAEPLGCPDALEGAIFELAGVEDPEAPLRAEPRPAWEGFLQRAKESVGLGEVSVRPVAPDLYEVRPVLDMGRRDLETLVTPEGVRDRTRVSDGGEHRPIRTLRDAPRGWRAVLQPDDLERAVEWLYPGVLDQAALHERAELMITPWPALARRQTGTDARVRQASAELVDRTRRDLCSRCLRTPLWAGEPLRGTVHSGAPGQMPCAEACTLFIMRVRDAVTAS
jgi:sirohydrochlorin cobaltochelatase